DLARRTARCHAAPRKTRVSRATERHDRSRYFRGLHARPRHRPGRAARQPRVGRARAHQALRSLVLAGRAVAGRRRPARGHRPPLSPPRTWRRAGRRERRRTPMKKLLRLLPLVLFLGVAALLYRGLFLDPARLPSALVGKSFPEFTLLSLDDAR